MKARFTSIKKILDLFLYHELLSPKDIIEFSKLQKSVVHKYLKQLYDEWKLQKIGKPPSVQYKLSESEQKIQWEIDVKEKNLTRLIFWYQERIILDKAFLKFWPTGRLYTWIQGLAGWCHDCSLGYHQKIDDYIKIVKYIESQQDECWLLSADEAFGKDFEEKYVDKAYYADQYKYMDFWRGKLAELTFYAKQSQNKKLIAESIAEILPKLECHILRQKYDALAIIPWSIKRENQLLRFLKKELESFGLPFVNIVKYSSSGICIPQKSLKTRRERIDNAKNTIFIDDENMQQYKKVFLIDDFVGSWSTLNETAKKLKEQWVQEVVGFAFVWNTNLHYEVIREI